MEELLPVQNSWLLEEVFDESYRVWVVDTLSEYSPKLKSAKNTFIICKKISKDVEELYDEYIIDVPKLENWQIQDFVYSVAKGVDTDDLNELIKICNNDIFRINQELKKIRLFDEKERKYAFKDFKSDGIFSDLSELTIFDLSSAIMKRDFNTIRRVLEVIDQIDVEPIGLQKVLLNNFRDVILVQLNINPTPQYFEQKFGWKSGKFWAIKYTCSYYTKEQLINIFKFLTSIKFGDIPEDKLVSYLITHIMSM